MPQGKFCSKQPIHACHNVSFVVDLHALDFPKDIPADENGVWRRNGSPVTYVSVHGAKVFHCKKNGQSFASLQSFMYLQDFRRVITTVHSKFI